MSEGLKTAVKSAHEELWKRFIYKPYGIILDFADLDGSVDIPTPDDCLEGRINGMSWWTPIENGAFFNGIYLEALCNGWKLEGKEDLKEKARIIANGLLLLSTVGSTPGFIARGVVNDGKTHYAIGSDDQTGPWFYGLWKYIKSGIPTEDEKKIIVDQMLTVASALEKIEWKLPCDGIDQYRGNLLQGNFREVARILFILRTMYELSGDESWLESYYRRLDEKPKNSKYSRREICARGIAVDIVQYENLAQEHLWIIGQSQACLRELCRIEKDEGLRTVYMSGLNANAYMAYPFITEYRKFDSDSPLKYEVNWRLMNDKWHPQHTVEDAVKLAMEQFYDWEENQCPRRKLEASYMREPLFAAWMVALSGNSELVECSYKLIENCITKYNWKELYTSLFFVVECIYYEMLIER